MLYRYDVDMVGCEARGERGIGGDELLGTVLSELSVLWCKSLQLNYTAVHILYTKALDETSVLASVILSSTGAVLVLGDNSRLDPGNTT